MDIGFGRCFLTVVEFKTAATSVKKEHSHKSDDLQQENSHGIIETNEHLVK